MIVVAPKILLRHSSATSSLAEMAPNTSFQNVIGDNTVSDSHVKKVIFVSGKHYYALDKQREILGADDIAIIRLESLCPFPVVELNREIQRYPHAQSKKVYILSSLLYLRP